MDVLRRWTEMGDERRLLEQIERMVSEPLPKEAHRDPMDTFIADLARMQPYASDHFREQLEARLQAELRRPRETKRRSLLSNMSAMMGQGFLRTTKLGAIQALFVALTTLLAVPVVAATVLRYSAPREVSEIPTAIPGKVEIINPTPLGPGEPSIREVESQLGVTILVPTYLPSGCAPTEQFAWSDVDTAVLNYTCVSITERVARDEQPLVGTGSTERVVVGGEPAIYVKGAWVQHEGSKEQVWEDGFGQELILERNGLVIHISAGAAEESVIRTESGRTLYIGEDLVVTKEELIRIAESLRPAE